MSSNTKILIVEDDSFLAGMYVRKLESKNFKVILASDGLQGLKLAKQESPRLILLDILLPKLDGFEILENLKKDPKTESIPVILLTNLSQKENLEKALRLGVQDYLIKAHFMPSEVVEKIEKILGDKEKK